MNKNDALKHQAEVLGQYPREWASDMWNCQLSMLVCSLCPAAAIFGKLWGKQNIYGNQVISFEANPG